MALLAPKYSRMCDFDVELARGYYAAYQRYIDAFDSRRGGGSQGILSGGPAGGQGGERAPARVAAPGGGSRVANHLDWSAIGKKRGVADDPSPVRKRMRGRRGARSGAAASGVTAAVDEPVPVVRGSLAVAADPPQELGAPVVELKELLVVVDPLVRDYITFVVERKWAAAERASCELGALVRSVGSRWRGSKELATELFHLVQLSCAYLGKPGQCVFDSLGLGSGGGNCGGPSCSALAGSAGSALCSRDAVCLTYDEGCYLETVDGVSSETYQAADCDFRCLVCEMGFDDPLAFTEHQAGCMDLYWRTCSCGLVFPTTLEYVAHCNGGGCVSSENID